MPRLYVQHLMHDDWVVTDSPDVDRLKYGGAAKLHVRADGKFDADIPGMGRRIFDEVLKLGQTLKIIPRVKRR